MQIQQYQLFNIKCQISECHLIRYFAYSRIHNLKNCVKMTKTVTINIAVPGTALNVLKVIKAIRFNKQNISVKAQILGPNCLCHNLFPYFYFFHNVIVVSLIKMKIT